ncbi:hypothetical protein [Tsukamurella sp. USMM236]|uniref:hypothetical protein n=1 Tax=Tsukamurella sp. USMM236 TaxID=3081301 RepID=UPI0030186B67
MAAVLALLAAVLLALTSCSDGQAEPVAGATVSAAESTQGEASQAPASTTAAPAGAPVPGAYAGAGGPRPADAEPLPTYVAGGVKSAHLSTPSGGIKCDFQVADGTGYQGQCGVRKYASNSPFGCTTVAGGVCKGKWLFPFINDRVGEVRTTQGTTGWMNVTPSTGYAIPTVAYGKSVYFGEWVCASAYTGLTCWNTKSLSGVFLSNERSETFTGPGSAAPSPTTATTAAETEAPSRAAIVLGSMPSNGTGYGTERPAEVYNGGSITGRVTGIAWSSWGGERAEGRGTGYNAMGSVMDGAPETYPVQLIAFDPGTCNGKRAYRRLFVGTANQAFNPASAIDVCNA